MQHCCNSIVRFLPVDGRNRLQRTKEKWPKKNENYYYKVAMKQRKTGYVYFLHSKKLCKIISFIYTNTFPMSWDLTASVKTIFERILQIIIIVVCSSNVQMSKSMPTQRTSYIYILLNER